MHVSGVDWQRLSQRWLRGQIEGICCRRESAREVKQVIVAHDTTEFAFGGERKQLGRLSGKARGFVSHMTLALEAGWNHPLGVLHCESLVRGNKVKRRNSGKRVKDNEALRWSRAAKATHELVPDAIHVMDREADSYALLAQMRSPGQQSVVRVCYRQRQTTEGRIETLLENGELLAEREVMLSPRKRHEIERKEKRRPARRSRCARLQISSQRIKLERAWAIGANFPATLEHNLVFVREVDVPRGEVPVEWLLHAPLPVSTEAEVLTVVDAYRARSKRRRRCSTYSRSASP